MKNLQKKREAINQRRIARVRAVIIGTAERPRAVVRRSLRHTYLQLIDDTAQKTLVAASDAEFGKKKMKKLEAATAVGELAAKKAVAAKITAVVFDRHGRQYHGRVKAVADGMRSGGLTF